MRRRSSRGVVDIPSRSALAISRGTLARWRGQLEAAAAVTDRFDGLKDTDEQRNRVQLCLLGLAIEADRAELGRLTGALDAVERALAAGREYLGLLHRVCPPQLRTGDAERMTAEAEYSRIDGTADPEQYLTWPTNGRGSDAAGPRA